MVNPVALRSSYKQVTFELIFTFSHILLEIPVQLLQPFLEATTYDWLHCNFCIHLNNLLCNLGATAIDRSRECVCFHSFHGRNYTDDNGKCSIGHSLIRHTNLQLTTHCDNTVTILLWEARTRREDIYPALKCFVATIAIPLNKLSLLTINGAPAMTASKNWFTALWKNDDITPKLIPLYYCTFKFSVLKFLHLSRYGHNH
jgi:hypothetical protein